MSRFKIVNARLSLILAYITFSLPFALWLLRAYFLTIPPDMEQAAMIDGCSKLGASHRVLLPVALPGITAAGINTFITAWSEYMFAAIFISSEELKTLPPGITSSASQDMVLWGPLMASSVMMTIPALIFCLFAQKYLVSGLMAGSVKG
ncbi:MAG TPA: carbohydrate ABC transporter permease [Firmicutes bacterium]|nr:carbohydrate ABC transporter permease [Bacillota bacterium]